MKQHQPIQVNPQTVSTLGQWLDHPEGVAIGTDGAVYAGGEAGQLYRFNADRSVHEMANTGGFVLGLALDANANIHACDLRRRAVLRIAPDGKIAERSRGTNDMPFTCPNWPAFDAAGNLYVSDSGDFWSQAGSSRIFVIRPDDTTELFHAGPLHFANGMAIDPTDQWLYVVESTAARIVRVALHEPNGPIEVTHQLPENTVPDGIAFTHDSRIVIACYRPDMLYMGHPGGSVEILAQDHTGQLLRRPTNVAVAHNKLIVANLGGHHLTEIECDVRPRMLHRPQLG